MTQQLLTTLTPHPSNQKSERQSRKPLPPVTVIGEKSFQQKNQHKTLLPAFQKIAKQMPSEIIQGLLYIEVCKKTVYSTFSHTSPYTIHHPKSAHAEAPPKRFRSIRKYLERAFLRREIRLRETNTEHIAYLLQELWEQAEAIASGISDNNHKTPVDDALSLSLAGRKILHTFQRENDPKSICKEQIRLFAIKSLSFAENLYSRNKN